MSENDALGEYIPDLKPCPFCGRSVEITGVSECQDSWVSQARIECGHCLVEMEEFQSRKEYTNASGESYEALCVRIKHALCTRWNNRPDAMLAERSKAEGQT